MPLKKIIVTGLGGHETAHQLPNGQTLIGRNPQSDIRLSDPQVSWAHAAITHEQDHCVIDDLDSTNGTFIRGRRIERELLKDGDSIRIGPYELVFRSSQSSLSAESASEYTLFTKGVGHAHQIDGVKDPYATQLSDKVKHQVLRSRRRTGSRDEGTRRPSPGQRAATLLPVLEWGRRYRKGAFPGDLVAGMTVAAMLIPQGMAYALLAGVPPVMGLYASMLPMFVYALTGTGRQTSLGPNAVDSLMVAVGVGIFAQTGSEAYITLVLLVAAMVGVIQVAMGLLRLGFLVNFLSYPVLCGFTSAAAVIIAASQLEHLLGIGVPQDLSSGRALWDLAIRLHETNPLTFAIGAGSVLFLLGLKRWLPQIPGPFGLLVISTLVVGVLGLEAFGVNTVGEVPSALPAPGLPDLDWQDITRLTPLALSMALIGFAQTISVGKSLGNRYGYDIDANQELMALGLSNLGASLTQGYPVSGGLSRSAVNAQAGARTPLAAMVTAILMAFTVMYLTPLVQHLPHAALAAIILVSAVGLIDAEEVRYLFRVKKTEGLLLVLTFLATLIVGVTSGLLLGIVASILLFISLNTRPNAAVLGRLPGTNIFRNVDNFPEAETVPSLLVLRIDASLYFANTEFLKHKIRDVLRQGEGGLKAIILDASSVNDLDSSATTALHQIARNLQERRIEFFMAGVKGPVREVMIRSGLYNLLGGDHFFFTIDAAVKRYQSSRAGIREN